MLASFDWGVFFAAVGGVSAVAVAVFTGLAYRMGRGDASRASTEGERHAAVRHLLGREMEKAGAMAYRSTTTDAEAMEWRRHAQALIEASLGPAEAMIFEHFPPADELVSLTRERVITREQLNVQVGLHALASLVQRLDRLRIMEDFDPANWA